jgi:toxin ParE1/3/4
MSEVIKRPQAKTDLKQIWRYIARDNLSQADSFLRKLDNTMKTLSQNPYLGRNREEILPNLRSFAINNYVIFYYPLEEGIEVIRILHGARDIETFF